MRVPVELRRSYRLINHGPTTLIGAVAGGRSNVMAAAWVMALDFEPPKVAAVLASDTFTRELVDASGEFTVNLPTTAMLDTAYALGSLSGRDGDKLAALGVGTFPASRMSAPLVEGCVAWLECRVLPEPELERKYDLFVAEVVAAWAEDEFYVDGEWRFPAGGPSTVHHMAGGVFFATGERIVARRP